LLLLPIKLHQGGLLISILIKYHNLLLLGLDCLLVGSEYMWFSNGCWCISLFRCHSWTLPLLLLLCLSLLL